MSLPEAGLSGRRLIISVVLMTALLVLAWFVYRPALSGTFLLDDLPNLSDLEVVDDAKSARDFVLSGRAGPLGRPLALASFAVQSTSWDSGARPFLRINILIHLLNGLLLYLFIRQLARELHTRQSDTEFVALVTAAIWLLMPLLASSTLMVVQRMTTLSATFMLAGLTGYLLARRSLESSPKAALGGMSAALILATLLAVLTKENGALLPVLVLVLEATLLTPPQRLSKFRWRAWSAAFLVAPTFLILAFLASQASYSDDMVLRRDFTAWERLLTESRVLWDYAINAFFPRPAHFGPFHDTYEIARSLFEPATLVAAASWLCLIAGALVTRRKFPVAAFAVLWFVAGHLLESTTYPLELYFEHRNYLPIIGPVFALTYAASRVSGVYRKYARGALVLYTLVNTGVLFAITSLWGMPLQAATYWYVQQPDSVRTVTALATAQLREMGPGVAVITLEEFASRNPEHAYIRIPELTFACIGAPDRDNSAKLERLRADLPSVVFSHAALNMLDKLLTTVAQEDCAGVSKEDVTVLAYALLSNPRYGNSIDYRRSHHMLMARMAEMAGETEVTLEHLTQAIDYGPSDDLNMMMVTTLVAARRFDEARVYIESALDSLPWQPLRRYNSRKNLEQLKDYANELERLAQSDNKPRSNDTVEGDGHESSK